jgi:hypothetical protein
MTEDLANLVGAIGDAGIDTSSVVFVAPPREATIISALVASFSNTTLFRTLNQRVPGSPKPEPKTQQARRPLLRPFIAIFSSGLSVSAAGQCLWGAFRGRVSGEKIPVPGGYLRKISCTR